ncbi:MAG: sigma-70 family RNA polymerase sigma factor [Planctomycetota bacterium]
MSDPTDGELIHRAIEGDEDSFALLMLRYQEKAYWVAYHLTGQAEESRDITQEAFIRVYRALKRFDFSMSFYTWLYRIVVNLAIDRLRRSAKNRAISIDDMVDVLKDPDPGKHPGDRIESAELTRDVHATLEKLPPKYRTVIALRDLNGMSCKEIAATVKASHATVRWRLHMARKMFKEHWDRRLSKARRAVHDDM